ncbi:hypothetical protein VIGAN_07017800 [Vigna angularis var. angularis]|uniref:Uncharacterized protein n=1 Tax=Vigna angularis var. angularis TaxID=157739 RepID=A0A0S3SFG5_PHAAN|nr:hypothetical protein VIGAN_07017800 [Vigna angularis var. angularis]
MLHHHLTQKYHSSYLKNINQFEQQQTSSSVIPGLPASLMPISACILNSLIHGCYIQILILKFVICLMLKQPTCKRHWNTQFGSLILMTIHDLMYLSHAS